jgi:hypothetical protein
MADLQIDKLLRGVASGHYVHELGSQFGSIWGFDGLMEAKAAPEQYAGFRASPKVSLCHGKPITWLGQDWSVILAYKRGQLAQVNIHTDPTDAIFDNVSAYLELLLGKGQMTELPEDISQSVLRRLIWNGRDAAVWVVCTPTFLQLSIQRHTWVRRTVEKALRFFGIRCLSSA